ncbi:MAG: choice-of-anchor D domain-containing protein [Sedimentisphaerales bacterium]|nr:choice-of-anchor D domain-containing protein [Sedimentisphaerales bacterium]
MLKRFKHSKDRTSPPSANSKSPDPVFLEKLEPRILLSGDGLLCSAALDPLIDTRPNVVQHAELLETSEHFNTKPTGYQEIYQEANPSHPDGTDLLQPILTLTIEDNHSTQDRELNEKVINGVDTSEESPNEFNLDEVDLAQIEIHSVVHSEDSNRSIANEMFLAEVVGIAVENPKKTIAVPIEDSNIPEYITDADVGIEEALSIEIRGPPTESGELTTLLNSEIYVESDEFAELSDEGNSYQLKAPDLPGLQLENADISSWEEQIIYLDFDGEENVCYEGPVTVGPFDVPEFEASNALAGQGESIIAEVLSELEELFAGTGIHFTIEQPTSGTDYSTVYIGGDDSAFCQYGSFFGLAEQVDSGNQDRNDNALVFTEEILSNRYDINQAAQALVSIISHELGHLLGYEHDQEDGVEHSTEIAGESSPLCDVAAAIDDSDVFLGFIPTIEFDLSDVNIIDSTDLDNDEYQAVSDQEDIITLSEGQILFLGSGPSPSEVRIDLPINISAADTLNTDQLWPGGDLGLDLTGEGLTVGIWEAAEGEGEYYVRDTHQELIGRVSYGDTSGSPSYSEHATHVAGTIGASGVDPDAQGMANEINILSHSEENCIYEMDRNADLIVVSNHSYSIMAGWDLVYVSGIGIVDFWVGDRRFSTEEDSYFGRYDSYTQELDEVLYENPNLLSIWSAGNDRSDHFTNISGDNTYVTYLFSNPGNLSGWYGAGWYIVPNSGATSAPGGDGDNGWGYDSLPPDQTAKNTLVVGAIEDITADPYNWSDVSLTSFSSWGPTDDGRIKPDVVASGLDVYSCAGSSDDAYLQASGTSCAAPTVTGTAALLIQHFYNLYGYYPLSSTTKGLLIHTAFDVGHLGPDYYYGWGVVDAAAAATFLSDSQDSTATTSICEETYTGSDITYSVQCNGDEPLKVTIAWTDPAGEVPGSGLDVRTPVLVNDLDLWVTGPDGTVYYPWTLNADSPNDPAVRTDPNHLDNVEQVLIDVTQPGTYTIHIGSTGEEFVQDFALLASAPFIASQAVPYVQTFDDEKPGIDEGWEYYSDNEGRIEVIEGWMRMDDSVNNVAYSQNEAIFHIDLTNKTDAILTLDHRCLGDESTSLPDSFEGHCSGDGIALSVDGWHWIKVTDLSDDFTGQSFNLGPMIQQALAAAGSSDLSNVCIKFQQYSNDSDATEGREFDNIIITTPAVPEIEILGNSQEIQDGDTTPNTSDDTDFGSVYAFGVSTTRTFTIANTGSAYLNLTGSPYYVVITGNTDFAVTRQPASIVAANGGTTTFEVTFDPGSYGIKTATISIANSDSDEALYDFVIQGMGVLFGDEQIISTQADGVLSVYASDLDGDGDDDVLSATGFDLIVWYENLGDGTFGDQQVISTEADGLKCLYACDLDGDGDNDVLSASWHDNKIAWYENLGDGVFGDQQVIGTVIQAAVSVFACDLDGDGDNDVLSGSWDQIIAWYENLGMGNFGSQQIVTTETQGPESVIACDLDGDGDNDILAARGRYNRVVWFENLGEGIFGEQQYLSESGEQAESIYACDLDGDGDNDILYAAHGYDMIAWYQNLGGGTFSSRQVISREANGVESIYACDVDGDGDNDILSASNYDDKIAWYENLGGGTFGNQLIISTQADDAQSVYACDVDGDGDNDVLSASISDDKIAWYENLLPIPEGPQEIEVLGDHQTIWDGGTTVSLNNLTDFGGVSILGDSMTQTYTIRNLGSTDLNLTGNPNRVVITGSDDFEVTVQPVSTVVANGGEVTFEITFTPTSLGTKTAAISIANNDSDENPFDFVIQGTGIAPEIEVLGNGQLILDGDTTPDPSDHTDFGCVNVTDVSITQTFTIKNVGLADLILMGTIITGDTDFTVTTYPTSPVDANGGTVTIEISFDPSTHGLKTATISIVNNDTDESFYDFVLSGFGADGGFVLGGWQSISTQTDGAYSVYACDLDGDGDNDVLSASLEDDKIAWYENLGAWTFGEQQVIDIQGGGARCVYACDLDGDGDNDVLGAFVLGDKIAWYENLGGGIFGGRQVISAQVNGALSVYACDLDGDGDNDILSASAYDQKIAWYENLGDGAFSVQKIIAQQVDYASCVYACDLDGDGDNDVLSASRNDDEIAWYENLGNGLFSSGQVITTQADGAMSVYACDLDGDGDNDVLSALQLGNTVAWYENLGDGLFGDRQVISRQARDTYSAYACDLDGDGDNDILWASYRDDIIAWHENLGAGTFGDPNILTNEADGAFMVYACDLDGDGDNDVLSALHLDDTIAWYENKKADSAGSPEIDVEQDGTEDVHEYSFDELEVGQSVSQQLVVRNEGETVLRITQVAGLVSPFSMSSANSSGSTDDWIIPVGEIRIFTISFSPDNIGQFNDTLVIRSNDSDESCYQIELNGRTTAGPEIEVLGDGQVILDGDTSPSPSDYTDFGNVYMLYRSVTRTFTIRNTGSEDLNLTGSPDPIVVTGSSDFVVTLQPSSTVAGNGGTTTFEITFDPSSYGKKTATISIASYDYNENPYVFVIQGGGVLFGNEQVLSMEEDGASSVYACDLDGDGDNDVLSASMDGDEIAWYENLGEGVFSVKQSISTEADGAVSVYVADLDGDGDNDVLSASYDDNTIAWYENQGGGVFGAKKSISTEVYGAMSVYAVDLDGDGDNDVLSASDIDGTIAWYDNIDKGYFGSQQIISSNANGAMSVYAADLDGDGDYDVLSASYYDDTIAWYENLGWSEFGDQHIVSTRSDRPQSAIACDLNDDGDLDILTASVVDDMVAWYENLGGGTFGGQQVISLQAERARSVYAADLDDDGDIDILSASSADDTIAWYENLGVGIFSDQRTISTQADGARSVFACDLNGDGINDVLSASYNDNKIAWYENLKPSGPEISILGNSQIIVNGDVTANVTDGTDFGSVNMAGGSVGHTFTINNTGSEDLNLTGVPERVIITGSTDFTVAAQPVSPVVAGGQTVFEITFDPSSPGLQTATVTIANNDTGANPYNFTIQGTGIEDMISPTIDQLSPADDSVDVSVDTNLTIVFSEDIRAGSVNIEIKRMSDDTVVEVILVSGDRVTIFGSQAVIDPVSDLSEQTEYYILIDTGAFEDLNDNAFAGVSDKTAWTFTTEIVNEPPILDPIGDKSINESAELTFTVTASDSDVPVNHLTFSLTNAPDDAYIDPDTGQFTWIPTEEQGPGVYAFDIVVTDDGIPTLSDSETISVTVREVNDAPVLAEIGDKTLDEEALLSFTVTASDPDDVPPNGLILYAENLPSGATFDVSTGLFTWMPTESQQGSYEVTFTVIDDGTPSLNDSETITITVNEVNDAPVLTEIGDKVVDEESLLTFTVTASEPNDAPANVLTLSVTGLPSGAIFEASTGEFTWVPSEGQKGSYDVTFTVTDDGDPNLGDSETITITVNDDGNRINGSTWHDANENGVWDVDEPGLADWTIYLDLNDNGQLDEGEPSATTDSDGYYSFINLAPGTYSVREVVPNQWEQTYPLDGVHTIQVNPEEVVKNLNFGNIARVVFVDSNLKVAVESALGITDPTGFEMLALTTLFTGHQDIWDLTGLEFAENLEYLSLWSNHIGDISPLYGLSNLKQLDLSNNHITEFESPASWSSLTGLDLSDNQISELPSLTNLSSIRTLDLSGNNMSDLTPLTELTSLTYLDLRDNPLNNQAYLSVLAQIERNNPGIELLYDPRPSGEIHGFVWNDTDGDGFWDQDEVGLEDQTVTLDCEEDSSFETITVQTDADGYYVFTGLLPGTCIVSQDPANDWELTYPLTEGEYTIILGANEIVVGINFGNAHNEAPVIDTLIVEPDPVVQGKDFALIAHGVTDDHVVVSVTFYRDDNSNGVGESVELLGVDTDGSDGWSWTGPVTWEPGDYSYLAQATDDGIPLETKTSDWTATTGKVRDALTITTDSELPQAVLDLPYSTYLLTTGGIEPYTWSFEAVGDDIYVETDPGLGSAAGGTAMDWRADDASYEFTLPWTFTYYGIEYNSVWVCTNGYLDFASSKSDFTNSQAELVENVRIAPLWDDLVTYDGGDIYIDTSNPDAVTIRWEGQTYKSDYPVDFMVTLSRDGTIRFDYGSAHSGLTPTIGISAGDGLHYTLSNRDGAGEIQADVASLFAVAGNPLPEGLFLNPATGEISGVPTELGTFKFAIVATDSDTPTNTISQTFSLEVKALPDLLGMYCDVLADQADWGESFEVAYVVLNQGSASTGGSSFDVGFYLSEDMDFDAEEDAYLAAFSISELAAGADMSGTVTATLPSLSPFTAQSGTFYIVMFCDDTEHIDESNETNNHGTGYLIDYDTFEVFVITTSSSLPTASLNSPYSVFIEAEGGVGSYTWSVQVADDTYIETDVEFESESGGTAMGWQADDESYELTLPWTFTFYGTDYDSVWVCTNGFLDFSSSTTDCSNTTAELLSNARIAPLWDDLTMEEGDIYVDTTDPDAVTIRWVGWTVSDEELVDFMVTLNRDGSIRFDYNQFNSDLTPTIGLSAGDGEHYTLSSRNGASEISSSVASLFTLVGDPFPPGLSLNEATGEITGVPTEADTFEFTIVVTDSDTPVNTVSKDFILVVGASDLIGTYCSVIPDWIDWGETFDVDYTILNQGSDDAGAFNIGFYLSEDTDFDMGVDSFLSTVSVTQLAMGASMNGTETVTLPSSSPFTADTGTFYVIMFSDDLNGVVESDETNNHSMGYQIDYDQVTVPITNLIAHNPNPAKGAIHMDTWASLSWEAGDTAVSHDIYFGESFTDVQDGTGDTFRGNQTSTFFVVGYPGFPYPDGLVPGTTYYWRIDEVEADGVTKHTGVVWNFTTDNFLVLDDFESYTDNDAAGEAIWQHWIDGIGVASNGSQVGYLIPPYAEQSIVHSGSQSMPFFYDNTGGVTNSVAELTLTWPRDWTIGEVSELSLWFRGTSANSAEPLYVAISDSSGASAVVINADPIATQVNVWTEWCVPLQTFTEMGIALNSVDKIALGLGSMSGVSVGGTGKMYFDDIRLY